MECWCAMWMSGRRLCLCIVPVDARTSDEEVSVHVEHPRLLDTVSSYAALWPAAVPKVKVSFGISCLVASLFQ